MQQQEPESEWKGTNKHWRDLVEICPSCQADASTSMGLVLHALAALSSLTADSGYFARTLKLSLYNERSHVLSVSRIVSDEELQLLLLIALQMY